MELFWKAAAAVLLSVILGLSVGKREPDLSVLLMMAVCCMTGITALSFLDPVIAFAKQLEVLTQMDGELLGRLLKLVGIGIVGELAGLICSDAGSSSLGKSLQILASAVILYLSVPLYETLMTLVREILGVL